MSAMEKIAILGSRIITVTSDSYLWLGQGFVGPVSIEFIWLLVVAVFSYLLLQKSVFGRHLYIMGSSEKSAFLAGINTSSTCLITYIIVGVLSALAGIVYTAHYSVANNYAGRNMEIAIIAAVVVGGANLSGGKGTVLNTVAGVLVLELIFNALALNNVNPYWVPVIQGFIIMAAVAIDRLIGKEKYR